VVAFLSPTARKQTLVRAVKKSGVLQVVFEGPLLVCKVRSLKTAKIADIPGINGIAAARQVSTGFSDVVGAIVAAGAKAIIPGEKFFVKAILTAKTEYVERDIEFASAGTLVEKLAKINVLPAKSEQECDRLILAVVGKKAAYVCVRDKTELSL
jgi:hypothetical protein